MFIGHYAVALAAKAAEPRAPLWSYVVASQLVDWGWSSLVMAGVEHLSLDPTLPGSHLVLYDMPWTHSLPAAVLWSLGGGLAARWVLKVPSPAAVMVGAVVFSHWLLDLLVHRPDLLVYPGGPKIGLGLWNLPTPELILELGMMAVAAVLWTGQRKAEGRRAWPAALFVGLLAVLQLVNALLPGDGAPADMARTALIAYVAVAVWAGWMDRQPAPRAV